MLTTVALLLAAVWNFHSLSPQLQAIRIVSFAAKKQPLVTPVNSAGNYATVLTSGGALEGSAVTSPILFQRFPFGWQPLALLNFQCELSGYGLSSSAIAILMRGMPAPQDDRPCTPMNRFFGDAGPVQDVDAVREQMRGPLVPYVVVAGDWAKGEWYGAGGGESFYRRKAGTWKLVIVDGGAMGIDEMPKLGVPKSAWCALRIYNATCTPK